MSLWLWIAMSGLAAAVLLLGWPGARWWRRALAVLSVPLCVLCATLALNVWVGYFPTVLAAWNQLTAGPLPDQIDRLRVTEMQVAGTRPAKGVVVPVNISADASHFPHREELVYLPPAWFNSNPPPRLPIVMMIRTTGLAPRAGSMARRCSARRKKPSGSMPSWRRSTGQLPSAWRSSICPTTGMCD